jgi:hypothetical protein
VQIYFAIIHSSQIYLTAESLGEENLGFLTYIVYDSTSVKEIQLRTVQLNRVSGPVVMEVNSETVMASECDLRP